MGVMEASVSSKRLTIRCSKADQYAACAPSAVDQPWQIGGERGAADLGSAAHKLITCGIGGKDLDLISVAHEYQVDPQELEQLMRWGWSIWNKVKKHFTPANCEVELDHAWPDVYLTGHIDVLHVDTDGAEARICDFKTGRLDNDHQHQLKAYAWLVCCNRAAVEKVRVCTLHWRQGQADWETYTRAELADWWDWLRKHLEDQTTYRPGPACRFCPLAATCPGKNALLQQAFTTLGSTITLPASLPERGSALANLKDMISQVEKFAEDAKNMIKADLAAHGGSLPMDNGWTIRLKDQANRKISVANGWKILEDELGNEAVTGLLQISKTAVEKALRDAAPKGAKQHYVDQVLDDLDKAGALTVHHSYPIEIVKGGTHDRRTVSATATTATPAIGATAGDGD